MSTCFLRRLAALTALLSCLPLTPGAAWAAPTISLQPSSHEIELGQPFSVNVVAEDLSDLYAFQFDVTYDPAILMLNLIEEGEFLATAGPTFFDPGSLDPAAGLLSFTLGSLLGAGPGANGSGVLATLSFGSIAGGNTALSLLNVVLLDSQVNDIAADVTGASIFINEPGVPALLVAALAAARPWRRRTRRCGRCLSPGSRQRPRTSPPPRR